MSLALLMTGSGAEPSFAFEHGNSHHQINDRWNGFVDYLNQSWVEQHIVIGQPQISVEPYWFSPRSPAAGQPASMWALKHQDSHNLISQQTTTASWWLGYFPLPVTTTTSLHVTSDQNMVDTDMNQPGGNRRWTVFANLQAHVAALLATSA